MQFLWVPSTQTNPQPIYQVSKVNTAFPEVEAYIFGVAAVKEKDKRAMEKGERVN